MLPVELLKQFLQRLPWLVSNLQTTLIDFSVWASMVSKFTLPIRMSGVFVMAARRHVANTEFLRLQRLSLASPFSDKKK